MNPQADLGRVCACGAATSRKLLSDAAGVDELSARAGKSVRLVGVQPKGQPFEIIGGPVELSLSAIKEMFDDSKVRTART